MTGEITFLLQMKQEEIMLKCQIEMCHFIDRFHLQVCQSLIIQELPVALQVRNLTYMVTRREKMKRSLWRVQEQIFQHQVRLLDNELLTGQSARWIMRHVMFCFCFSRQKLRISLKVGNSQHSFLLHFFTIWLMLINYKIIYSLLIIKVMCDLYTYI